MDARIRRGPPPLDYYRERLLLRRAQAGDKLAQEALVTQFSALAQYWVRRVMAKFSLQFESLPEREDKIAMALTAIHDAIQTFDVQRGTRFSTHLVWRIRAALRDVYDWQITEARRHCAEQAFVNAADIVAASLRAYEAKEAVDCGPGGGVGADLAHHIRQQELSAIGSDALAYALGLLNDTEHSAICYFFGLDGFPQLTWTQICRTMHISRPSLVKVRARAIEHLRRQIESYLSAHELTPNDVPIIFLD